MNEKLIRLAERRERLVAQAAAQRMALAQNIEPWRNPLARADQGLAALVSKPTSSPVPRNWKSDGYLQDVPMDPWGEQYQYMNDAGKSKIFSFGPDGRDGNTQIGNWNMSEAEANA